MVQLRWKTVWRFCKLKINLPCDPAILLLGIYPEKNMIQKDTCIPVFTATLFTIAKTWKQPKCPLTEKWIRKVWYIHTIECYLAIKKNEIMPFAASWMDLDSVIMSEVKQEKLSYDIPYIHNLKRNDTNEFIYETEADS